MLKQFGKTKLSRRSAGFIKAFRDPPLAPATVLCLSFIGFGVLCRGAHIGLAPSLYTTVFIFALPAQVVLVDQIARDIPLWTTALAVAFTGVRLLSMTVCTGTRKSPLNIFSAVLLTIHAPFAPSAARVAFVIYPYISKAWCR